MNCGADIVELEVSRSAISRAPKAARFRACFRSVPRGRSLLIFRASHFLGGSWGAHIFISFALCAPMESSSCASRGTGVALRSPRGARGCKTRMDATSGSMRCCRAVCGERGGGCRLGWAISVPVWRNMVEARWLRPRLFLDSLNARLREPSHGVFRMLFLSFISRSRVHSAGMDCVDLYSFKKTENFPKNTLPVVPSVWFYQESSVSHPPESPPLHTPKSPLFRPVILLSARVIFTRSQREISVLF